MKIIVNPQYEYLYEKIKQIPTLFEKRGEVVYDGRNILKRTTIGGVDVVIKSFKKPHLINRIVYTFFRKSKAFRSYIYSMEIQKHGFSTPEPVAMIEQYSKGLLSHSYYICCYDDGETVRALMDGVVAGNEDKLKAFAHYTAALHTAGILHLDYSPGNILIHQADKGEYYFSLVDVNRMRLVNDVDCPAAAENLRRLCNSREVLSYIAKQYALLRGWDVRKMDQLATCYSDKFFADYIFRRAGRKIQGKHIATIIIYFKLCRYFRQQLSSSCTLHQQLYNKEKQMYNTYFSQYDYRHILTGEYSM